MNEITVLVIEDNEISMKLVKSLLTLGKYRVLEAENAEIGIELARDNHPDLILMDIQLPGMDGLTATRIIKEDPALKAIPVMAVTAYVMAGDKEKAIEAGCDGYISKPIETRTFLDTISKFIKYDEGKEPYAAKTSTPKNKIMIVDDEPLKVRLLAANLPDDEYEITEAHGGEEALRKVAIENPDLILLNITIPGINGYDVTKILKNNPMTWAIPVLLITDPDNQESQTKGLAAGADELFIKPVDATELLAKINSMLQLKQYREQLKVRQQSVDFFSDRACLEKRVEKDLPVILIVDDVETDIRLIQNYLRGEPYHIIIDRTGEEAVSLAEHKKIDLILLDIILPNMSGYEIASRLKDMEETKDIPVIFISALHDLDSKIKGIKTGAVDFMTKPIDSRELRITINNIIKKTALMAEFRSQRLTASYTATTDILTGLHSPAYFKRLLEIEIKRSLRQKYPIALIMVDLDDFKNINDTLGYLTGDYILLKTGQIIKDNLREIDVAARYGGEEFAIAFPYTDKPRISTVVERLRQSISSHAFLEDPSNPGQITACFGIVCYSSDAMTSDDLIKKAKLMLLEAKKKGKNQVCVYDSGSGELTHI